MKYYLTLNEKTKITGGYIDTIHKDIPKDAIEVSELVWKQRLNDSSLNCYENGKLVKKDFTTNEQKEQARIQAINSKSESIITTPYPIYKQLNIDNELAPYTYQDRELKNMFIESVREIGKQAKNDGIAVEDIDWAGLDEITDPIQIDKAVLTSLLEKFKLL